MKCTYCKRDTVTARSAPTINYPLTFTWDHFIPLSKGGLRGAVNKVPACLRCNSLKGNMMPKDWEAYMQANPQWWARDRRQRRAAREPTEPAPPLPMDHTKYILTHGTKAYRAWAARQHT